MDYKHIIAVVIGIALAIVSQKAGIDLSGACPAAPAVVVPVGK